MKWIKRFLSAVAVLVLLLAGAFFVIRRLSHERPDWYPERGLDEASRAIAARSVEDKLIGVQNWAIDINANERNRQGGIVPGAPGYIAAPEGVKHVSFTEAELNAFFSQWDQAMHWKEQYSEFVEDPVLVLQDNRLILAATVKDLDMLVSVHFEPSLDANGDLHLTVTRVMGGKIPLPRALWEGYRAKLAEVVAGKIDRSRQRARIAEDGTMNHDAMVAAMNKLVLHVLDDEPAEPILFLRHDNLHNNAFPVKLTQVTVADKTIDMTVIPLDRKEREALLQRIQAPFDKTPNAGP